MTCNNNAFGKTICSICYEDLKPLIEDLQSISICGHVFHELCLQQWLEYCAQTKKRKCPVCNQKCGQEHVNRLYFQSVGDPNDSNLSQKKLFEEEDEKDSIFLNLEVKKLKGKLSALSTGFERQQQDLKELNEELCVCKEEVKKEAASKNEALQQKASIQQLFRLKSEEFVNKSAECSRLQERNMALAKELAALKLVSDLNLDEEEVLKLASFGHGTNSKDTVDVLKKSLVLRNKSYKELMAQCNLLGRGETRTLRKLEKAKEKMKNLKTRLKELELALEEKDNEALRVLKASRNNSGETVDLSDIKWSSSTPNIHNFSSEDQMKQPAEAVMKPNLSGSLTNHTFQSRNLSNPELHTDSGVSNCKKNTVVIDVDLEKDFDLFEDNNCSKPPPPVYGRSSSFGFTDSSIANKKGMDDRLVGAIEKDVMHKSSPSSALDEPCLDEVTEIPSMLNIRKENSSPPQTSNPGGQLFGGGFLAPDGTRRYLGKWCKRNSSTMQGSTPGSGDLITVGADGRGGRVKVLRSQNHLDVKGSSFLSKRFKTGTKQVQQSQVQIDHFFVKANRS